MTKLCSACGTENRNEAQFCRACGTAFVAFPAAPAEAADGSTTNICAECGFRNKPGIRYCANCGVGLVADAGAATSSPTVEAPAASAPLVAAYPTLGSVAPYAPTADTDHSALFTERTRPDIPDPAAAIALRQKEGLESHGETTATFADAPAATPRRAGPVVAIVVALLVLGGIVAWFFMDRSNPAPPQPAAASPAPVTAPAPVAIRPAPPMIIEEAPASSPAPTTSSTSSSTGVVSSPVPAAATPPVVTAPPAAAPPSAAPPTALAPPAAGAQPTAGATAPAADADAKRIADAKRREKAARDKADRDAKAKTLAEQRDQTAAAQRADQEAQARRRADEAQRARASAPTTTPPAPVAQARGVRDICAGRGTIAEAICQSRQCGLAEHANEAVCRQLRDADERRRNTQN